MSNGKYSEPDVDIVVSQEAYAVLQHWIRSGAVSISEAIIIVNNQIAPKAIEKWVVR